MFRLPLSLLSPSGPRGRLSILIYHRVLPQADPLFPETPTAAQFEQRMHWVRSWFNVLALDDAIDRLYEGTLPPRALAITFDDGYADNEEHAAPILRRLGLTATFFVSTGFLGGHNMWNDRVIEAVRGCRRDELDLQPLGLGRLALRTDGERRQAVHALLGAVKHLEPAQRRDATQAIVERSGAGEAARLMMREDQVRSLRAMGMDIGAHTVTHPILSRLDAASAQDEIGSGKRELERIIDAPVNLFAYPNGVPSKDYADEHVRMVRECGFRAAVSTSWGAACAQSDRFQLPRFTPWDTTPVRFGVRMLANFRRREAVAA